VDIPLALASRIVVEHVLNEGWPVIPVQPSEIIGRIAKLHVAEVDDANGFGDARVVQDVCMREIAMEQRSRKDAAEGLVEKVRKSSKNHSTLIAIQQGKTRSWISRQFCCQKDSVCKAGTPWVVNAETSASCKIVKKEPR